MEKNLFELATRKKLRFQTSKGLLTVEDLWDLSLAHLDKIAIALQELVNKSTNVSFISKTSNASEVDQLSFEIVKHIIEVKLKEKDTEKAKAEKAAQRQFLQNIIETKKVEIFQNMSLEDLQKQLNSL